MLLPFLEDHVPLILFLAVIASGVVLAVVIVVVKYNYRLKVAWRNGSIDIDPPKKP
jgi:hypothetical protein